MSARRPLRLAILISGRGSNMVAIVRACLEGRIAARPVAVIADRADAAGLASGRKLGVESLTVSGAQVRDSVGFERSLQTTLKEREVEFIALAGFMRILSAAFVAEYLGRMFNVHPALLPAYRGLHTHRRVLAAHDTVHGASVHFVTADLDSGPVVLQSKVAVEPDDTEATLEARVLATEHIIYPRVLGWYAERRLRWREGIVWFDGAPLRAPMVEDFRARTQS